MESLEETFARWNRQPRPQAMEAASRHAFSERPPQRLLATAIVALEAIEGFGACYDLPSIVLETASDALAELRDPATGKPWDIEP